MPWWVLLVACEELMAPGPGLPGTAPPAPYVEGEAVQPLEQPLEVRVIGTEGHEGVRGEVRLEPVPGSGLRVVADVTGLEPGMHALLVGDCERPEAAVRLGGLDADESGVATLRTVVPEADAADLHGMAVVVVDETGRGVACGVIGIAGDAT